MTDVSSVYMPRAIVVKSESADYCHGGSRRETRHMGEEYDEMLGKVFFLDLGLHRAANIVRNNVLNKRVVSRLPPPVRIHQCL